MEAAFPSTGSSAVTWQRPLCRRDLPSAVAFRSPSYLASGESSAPRSAAAIGAALTLGVVCGAGARHSRKAHGASFSVVQSKPRRVTLQVFDRFREDAITAIYCAQEEAIRQSYGVVCSELIVFGILSDEQKGGKNKVAKSILVRNGVTREAVKRAVSNLASTRGATNFPGPSSLPFSEGAKLLFDVANAETEKGQEIGSEELLLALGSPQLADCGGAKLLAGLGLDSQQLRAALLVEMSDKGAAGGKRELAAVGAAGDDKKLTLDEVATDLTQMAMDGLLDPVVGRDAEMQRIIQILLRKRKNNACLVGPPGVGKTAVVEGLAQLIAQGKVPSKLKGKKVYSLDLGQLVAGTKYRGEFEERLKNVINEVTSSEGDICLFIDEIHQLVGAGVAGPDSSMDAANLLKPALARGELQVIGATTTDEYAKHIEKDGALERRFQKVICEEPSMLETLDILEGLRTSYEDHHGVLVSPEALRSAAQLSTRYMPERFLPDKAVDLLDEACSVAQLRAEAAEEEAFSMADTDGDGVLSREEFAKAGPSVDLGRPIVTASDIARVLSKWSGVPVERISEDESGRLLRLEETLTKRIVGQEEAVSSLARAVRRSRAGLSGGSRPIASLYFAGPTGVGKTELCKVLAKEYYSDPKAMIRLDMSEYSEQHSVSRLVGPPPGYVGYDDPRSGQLTEAVRRRPYSVVVLDEIEKAHPEVLNMLLQVLEDGRLTDGKGRTVSFSNCIVVMTSNVGSREILEQADSGGSYAAMRSAVETQLQQRFRPEFLNRIDELLVFQSLRERELTLIVQLALGDAAARAAYAHGEVAGQRSNAAQALPLELSWTADLAKLILGHGADVAYGARPVRRAVQRFFEDPLAELMVSGALTQGGPAVVDLEAGSSVVVRYGGTTLRASLTAVAQSSGSRQQLEASASLPAGAGPNPGAPPKAAMAVS